MIKERDERVPFIAALRGARDPQRNRDGVDRLATGAILINGCSELGPLGAALRTVPKLDSLGAAAIEAEAVALRTVAWIHDLDAHATDEPKKDSHGPRKIISPWSPFILTHLKIKAFQVPMNYSNPPRTKKTKEISNQQAFDPLFQTFLKRLKQGVTT